MGEERATPSQVRKPMYFGLFILGSIFQVCWVRAPISKAIVKHIQSEIKTENRGSLLWQGLLLEISMVTAGSAAGRELERDKVGEEKLSVREVSAHTLRPPPSS